MMNRTRIVTPDGQQNQATRISESLGEENWEGEQLRVIKVDEKESLESKRKKAKVVSTFLKHINCNIKIVESQLAIITLRIL